ncbi:DUF1573 domain-containing protein [Chryseobacterium sp. SL1]|uniref:DUF1573 domain-containing protein n=1 Tax=Chryseobacterium sp. SL1 TaxID=2995159 RepID=UPI002275A617|nr:DUF1573 domain-containing protein [Chryseobacterium sp. SL1]MCY1661261.1 DUF1573 domain-containing protein [Chryseobacterium sp. SL1]
MKRKTFIIILTLILAILIIALITHKREKHYYVELKGKADIPVREYNFGNITYLDTVNYNFVIKNIGDEPLIINKVLPNCNCTVVDYKESPILPNQQAEIKARFIPKKTVLGKNSATILVEGNFNDGVTELTLKGNVTDIK